jgi:dGTPase
MDPHLRQRSARSARWAATMAGHPSAGRHGLRVAHHGAPLVVPSPAFGRSAREDAEHAWLAPGATRAHGAGHRARAEEADPLRTCFERDRDRILHSGQFRRLAGVTQVFGNPADGQRTRLTHALEVAQIATAVARACRLNVALAEAIALGHDCGHPPGGHAGEDALSPYLAEGFDHAVWGATVTLAPLNLCVETLDGIANHSWSRPTPLTPEGEVVAFADRIAYLGHDLEDALAIGIVEPDDIPPSVAAAGGTERRDLIDVLVNALVTTICTTGTVGLPAPLAGVMADLRAFNDERIYHRPESLHQAGRIADAITLVVGRLRSGPGLSASSRPGWRDHADRVVVTRVAAMTDRALFDAAGART